MTATGRALYEESVADALIADLPALVHERLAFRRIGCRLRAAPA